MSDAIGMTVARPAMPGRAGLNCIEPGAWSAHLHFGVCGGWPPPKREH